MFDICLFAGTTEGRHIAEFLANTELSVLVCVATEYGETLIPTADNITVHRERLDRAAMEELFVREKFSLIIDATHPHAALVTENITEALKTSNIEYLRVQRESCEEAAKAVYVDSLSQAAKFLKGVEGNILITTGSKELLPYTQIPDYANRCYFRVLPTESSIVACMQVNIPPSHIIAMQGPFSEEMNCAVLHTINARYLVTKDSGSEGGFGEKILAAQKANAIPVVIGRPKKCSGLSVEQTIAFLEEKYSLQRKPEISIIGIGMGSEMLLTASAKEALSKAQCVIGAKRALEAVAAGRPGLATMDNNKILDFIRTHTQYRSIAVVMTGDVGFFSGARKLLPLLQEFHPKIYPGISSLQYLCAKAETSWDDAFILSLHGREGSAVPAVMAHEKVFVLVGGAGGVKRVLEDLCENGMGEVSVTVGERLSYPDEKITSGKAKELSGIAYDPLAVLLIRNGSAISPCACASLPDEAFLRSTGANVPMTKEEIRAISIAKLHLTPDAIAYDIGAGTGSVSVEMARICHAGRVYAVEHKADAATLAEKNKQHFDCHNLTIVQGAAPEACEGLPTPTHAFIGGTSGNMEQVIGMLLQKNPHIRIVMNLIALESMAEAVRCMEKFDFTETEVVQVSVAKAKKLGRYHLMKGQNPITIITMESPAACVGEIQQED